MRYIIICILLLCNSSIFAQNWDSIWKEKRKIETFNNHFKEDRRYKPEASKYTIYKDNVHCTFGYKKDSIKITPTIYEEAWSFVKGYAIVKKEGYWGVIDSNNNVVLPFKYQHLGWVTKQESINNRRSNSYYDTSRLYVGKNFKVGIITIRGDTILPIEYSQIEKDIDDVIIITKDSMSGIFADNKITVAPKYTSIHKFRDTPILSAAEGKVFKPIDKYGNILFPITGGYDNGVFYPDTIGNVIELKQALFHVDGTILFHTKKWTYNMLEYKKQHGVYVCKNITDSSTIVIDTLGNILLNYPDLLDFSDKGIAPARYKTGNVYKYRYIDFKGKNIDRKRYDLISKPIPVYRQIYGVSSNTIVLKNGKWGVLNENGEALIKPEYDAVGFNALYYPVWGQYYYTLLIKNNTIYAYDDQTGEVYPYHSDSSIFILGLRKDQTEKIDYYLVKDNSILLSTKSSYITIINASPKNTLYKLNNSNGCLLLNWQLDTIVKPGLYDAFQDGYSNFITAYKDGKMGLIDTTGNVLLPPKYLGVYPTYSFDPFTLFWVLSETTNPEVINNNIKPDDIYYDYPADTLKGVWYFYDSAFQRRSKNSYNQVQYHNTCDSALKIMGNNISIVAAPPSKECEEKDQPKKSIFKSYTGLVYVKQSGKWKIYKVEKPIIDESFDYVSEVYIDLLLVGNYDKDSNKIEGLLNTNGKYIVKPGYNAISNSKIDLAGLLGFYKQPFKTTYEPSDTFGKYIARMYEVNKHNEKFLLKLLTPECKHPHHVAINNQLISLVLESFLLDDRFYFKYDTTWSLTHFESYYDSIIGHSESPQISLGFPLVRILYISETTFKLHTNYYYNYGRFQSERHYYIKNGIIVEYTLKDVLTDIQVIAPFLYESLSKIDKPQYLCYDSATIEKEFTRGFIATPVGIEIAYNTVIPYSLIKEFLKPNNPLDEFINK